MREVVPVIAVTLLMTCSKPEKQPDTYVLHPRSRPAAVETDVRPHSTKPYDFRYRIEPPGVDDFRDHYRKPEKPAVRVSGEEPKLTPEARKARVSGIVILEVAIDAKGRPTHYLVLKPLPFGLDQAAVDCVRTWRFRPAMDHGRPVPAIQNVTVRFDPAP